ncbi:MAG: phosphatidate cytidylyltransferase, partial [Prevotellaceae bacterium]|nr:phosphatidate cytidylyltransferase [Candidatus Colivivens equi]
MKNLIIRCATGLAFVAILVSGILYGPSTFALVFGIITGMTVWEFCTIMNNHADCQINRMITTVAAVYFFGCILAFNANIATSEVFIPYT